MTFQTIDPSRFKHPSKRLHWKRVALAAVAALVVMAGYLYFFRGHASEGTHNSANGKSDSSTTDKKQAADLSETEKSSKDSFDKKQFSLEDPTSPWVIVNKHRPLNPKDYKPDVATPNVPLRLAAGSSEMMLSKLAIPSLELMFADAKAQGLSLMVASGYRSYGLQVSVYAAEVKNYGQAVADSESARPGFSEHQTGLALDIEPASRTCEVEDCFGETPEGKWLVANAHTYGFVLRYMPDGQTTTGYRAEAWHFRYVGKDLAGEIYKADNPPLETFFGLEAAADYQ